MSVDTLYWLLIIPIYKFLASLYKFYYLKRCRKTYEEYVKSYCPEDERKSVTKEQVKLHEKLLAELLSHKNKIIVLLKEAGVQDFRFTRMEPVGGGYGKRVEYSIHMNMEQIKELYVPGQETGADIPNEMIKALTQAIGIYKIKMYESFNPIYWGDIIIYLPSKILSYLKGEQITHSMKNLSLLLNVIYWVIIFIISLIRVLH